MVAGMASKSGWLFFPGELFRFARPRLPLVASGAIRERSQIGSEAILGFDGIIP
jgi:hypothetical protein